MTDLFALIQTQPEGKTLEFKQDASSPKSILKSLVAFANTAGGRLVIGVTDNKQLVSIECPLDEEERLCNLIADSISPRLVPNIELVTVNDKTLMIIEVFLSNSRPHWLNAEGAEDGVYVRLGSSNRKADHALIAELQRLVEGVAFDEMPMPELSIDDLDLGAAQQAFGGIRRLDKQAMLTLKLLTRHQGKLVPSKGGILLFGKHRLQHFSDAWIQCGRFFGTKKVDIFDHADIDKPLPQAVDEVMLFLKKHAFRGADLSDVRRKDVWSIPLGMLREAIINAIVHSDYSQRGAPIRVVFLDDRIEVESLGILLSGLTIEEMKQGTSRIRNHVIARVFRELNLIEQWGTGVRRIFEEAKEQGLPEPIIEEVGMRLRFTIYLAKSHKIDSTAKDEKKPNDSEEALRLRQESQLESQLESKLAAKVVVFLSEKEMGKAEIAQKLGHKSISGELNKQIKRLLDMDYIERTIPDKPNSRLQKYRLKKSDQ